MILHSPLYRRFLWVLLVFCHSLSALHTPGITPAQWLEIPTCLPHSVLNYTLFSPLITFTHLLPCPEYIYPLPHTVFCSSKQPFPSKMSSNAHPQSASHPTAFVFNAPPRMGFKQENTTQKANGEQKLLSKLGSDFQDQSTKWDFGAQIKNASNFAQALSTTHTTCVELDFRSNHSYSKFETDFQPENTLSVQPQNPPQGNPWNPAFSPAFSSVWVHPGFNFLSPTLSFALQTHQPNGITKSSFEQHPQGGSKYQIIWDFKEKSHPFSKGAQQPIGKGLSSMDNKMVMEETSKLTKVNAMRTTLSSLSLISMWICTIGGFTHGSSLGSKYGFHLEGPVHIPNVLPERAITLMKISPVTQAKLAPLVTLPNGSGIDSFTLPAANLSMILANSSVLYSQSVNFIISDFYASIPEPSALRLDPPGIGNPTLGPKVPSACGTSEFAHTQLSLQIHPLPHPVLSDTFNSEKRRIFT